MSERTSAFDIFKTRSHHAHPFTVESGENAQKKPVTLTGTQKKTAIAAGVIFGLITSPLLIVGGIGIGYGVFAGMTARMKAKAIKKQDSLEKKQNKPLSKPEEEVNKDIPENQKMRNRAVNENAGKTRELSAAAHQLFLLHERMKELDKAVSNEEAATPIKDKSDQAEEKIENKDEDTEKALPNDETEISAKNTVNQSEEKIENEDKSADRKQVIEDYDKLAAEAMTLFKEIAANNKKIAQLQIEINDTVAPKEKLKPEELKQYEIELSAAEKKDDEILKELLEQGEEIQRKLSEKNKPKIKDVKNTEIKEATALLLESLTLPEGEEKNAKINELVAKIKSLEKPFTLAEACKEVNFAASAIDREAKNKKNVLPRPVNVQSLEGINKAVNIGIQNEGNTCWLNSILKFMATSSWGERICNKDLSDYPDNYKELQQTLKNVMFSLHTEKSVSEQWVIEPQLIKELIRSLVEMEIIREDDVQLIMGRGKYNNQLDAGEMFVQLYALFNIPEENICQKQKIYSRDKETNIDNLYHAPGAFENLEVIVASVQTLPAVKKGLSSGMQKKDLLHSINKIDLNEMLLDEGVVAVQASHKLIDKRIWGDEVVSFREANAAEITNANGEVKNTIFNEKSIHLNLPNRTTIAYFPTVQPGKTRQNGTYEYPSYKVNIDFPIVKHNDHKCVMLNEYVPVANLSVDEDFQGPARNCYYNIKGAVIHLGDTPNGGHYTYLEQDENGTFKYHNDSTIKILDPNKPKENKEIDDLLGKGVLFDLELIEKVGINSEHEDKT